MVIICFLQLKRILLCFFKLFDGETDNIIINIIIIIIIISSSHDGLKKVSTWYHVESGVDVRLLCTTGVGIATNRSEDQIRVQHDSSWRQKINHCCQINIVTLVLLLLLLLLLLMVML